MNDASTPKSNDFTPEQPTEVIDLWKRLYGQHNTTPQAGAQKHRPLADRNPKTHLIRITDIFKSPKELRNSGRFPAGDEPTDPVGYIKAIQEPAHAELTKVDTSSIRAAYRKATREAKSHEERGKIKADYYEALAACSAHEYSISLRAAFSAVHLLKDDHLQQEIIEEAVAAALDSYDGKGMAEAELPLTLDGLRRLTIRIAERLKKQAEKRDFTKAQRRFEDPTDPDGSNQYAGSEKDSEDDLSYDPLEGDIRISLTRPDYIEANAIEDAIIAKIDAERAKPAVNYSRQALLKAMTEVVGVENLRWFNEYLAWSGNRLEGKAHPREGRPASSADRARAARIRAKVERFL